MVFIAEKLDDGFLLGKKNRKVFVERKKTVYPHLDVDPILQSLEFSSN